MAGPWEKYQQQQVPQASEGPWSKYQQSSPQVTPPADPAAQPKLGSAVGVPGLEHAALPEVTVEHVPADRIRQTSWQGAREGIASIPGSLVDLTTGAANLGIAGAEKAVNWFRDEPADFGRLGGPVTLPEWLPGVGGMKLAGPLGSTAQINQAVEKTLDLENIPEHTMTDTERLAYNINKLGAGAITGGGLLSRLSSATRPGTYSHELTRPYREGVESAATMPGPIRAEVEAAKPLMVDAASGAGAGAALTGSQEVFPDSPIADMAATMLGGLGGATAVTAGRVPSIAARNIYERNFVDPNIPFDPKTELGTSRHTADVAARQVQSQASDPEAAAAAIRQRSQEAIEAGDPMSTSGTASGDIGLMAGERGARLRDPVPFQERDQTLKDAAEERVTGLRDPYADPRAAQRFVEKDVAQQRETAAKPVAEAEGRLTSAQEAEQALGGTVQARRGGTVQASERLDEAIGQTKQADTARKSGLYREAETLGRETRVGGDTLANDAAAIRSEISPLAAQDQSLNNVLRDLDTLATVEGEAAGLTATDLIQMRPRLSRARDAASRLSRGDTVERLDRINGGIKAQLDSLADQGDPAALKWQEAEANFRDDFAPKYREGVGKQLDKAERAGSPVPSTQVGGRFLGGSKEAAENLKTILRNSSSKAEGDAAARDFVLSDMATVVDKNGKINIHALRSWIGNREGLFQAMPNLREEAQQMLRDAVNRRGATTSLEKELKAATEGLKRTEADIQNSATALLLDADPKNAASRVFSHRDPEKAMREITAKVKADPEALAGWKRAVTDHMIRRVTTTNTAMSVGSDGPVSIAALKNFFDDNAKALAAVYAPQEMQSLRRAHKILEPLGNLQRSAVSGSQTVENQVLKEKTWGLLEVGFKATYGILKGGGIMRTLKIAAKQLAGDDDPVEQLVKRMYLDPELAQHLLTRNVKEVGSTGWNRRLVKLLAVSEGAREINDDE
jgi:hypothetical protein